MIWKSKISTTIMRKNGNYILRDPKSCVLFTTCYTQYCKHKGTEQEGFYTMKVKTIIRTIDGEKFEDVQEIAEVFTREEVEKDLEENRMEFQNALMDNQNNYYTMYIDNGTVVFNLNHIVSLRTEIIED